MSAVLLPEDHPHWIKFWVDGGILMAGRNSRKTRGVYWSMRCEDPTVSEPVIIRRQDLTFRTNNDAEWLAVREGLLYAVEHYPKSVEGTAPARHIIIYSDSMLVVKQFTAEWRAKMARHHRLRTECKALAERLSFVVLQWVPREVNVEKLGH